MGTAFLTKAELPKVDFQDIPHMWFKYLGRVYPVVSASTAIFRAAVLQRAPKWRRNVEYWAILNQRDLDLYDRWWLLCCLADERRAITLYESREDAG
jgi:hypothetical protein